MRSSNVGLTIFGTAGLFAAMVAFAAPPAPIGADAANERYAKTMLETGKKTFRYETFGSEAFWGECHVNSKYCSLLVKRNFRRQRNQSHSVKRCGQVGYRKYLADLT